MIDYDAYNALKEDAQQQLPQNNHGQQYMSPQYPQQQYVQHQPMPQQQYPPQQNMPQQQQNMPPPYAAGFVANPDMYEGKHHV